MALDLWVMGYLQRVGSDYPVHPDPDEPEWLFPRAWDVYVDAMAEDSQ